MLTAETLQLSLYMRIKFYYLQHVDYLYLDAPADEQSIIYRQNCVWVNHCCLRIDINKSHVKDYLVEWIRHTRGGLIH